MYIPLPLVHRSEDCAGSWFRRPVLSSALWQCSRCGYAYPETPEVISAVTDEEMLSAWLLRLTAEGEELLAAPQDD